MSAALMYGERRDALLRAVVTVVAREGLRSLTYRSLAKEAGVSHGLIAHHFGSIDALLAGALEASIEATAEALELVPASDDIDDFARDLVAGVTKQADDLAFQYQVMLESRLSGDVGGLIRLLHQAYRGIIAEALQKIRVASDPGTVELVYAALEGIVFHQLVHVDEDVNEMALERLRHLLHTAAAS